MNKLPTLITPRHELVIPSTGKTVSFRPYLVKEEKILLIALESNNPKQIFGAMQDVIKACTFGEVEVDSLTSFDIEYIFLQLRIKSVGEKATVKLKCEKDEAYTEVDIDLTQIQVTKPAQFKEKMDIQLTDKIGMVLHPIKALDILRLESQTDNNKSNLITDLVIATIDHIYDDSKIYKAEDSSQEELRAFVDSLNRSQIEKIQKYIESFPRLEHKVTFTCIKCGHINTVTLTGIQSFFG